ncbi:MAG: class I tRNA ligase family protein, partial [Rhodothermales bacterium]
MSDPTASRFPELKQFEHDALEAEVLERWDRYNVFERSISNREGAPHFTFYEGPPTANGRPGLHHMVARTIKDTFCRYKTMKGYQVQRKAGWDTHGLPVEIEVEKALKLKGRAQVQEFGIERFNKACRESVMQYKDLWDRLTTRMGYWVDLDDPYITFKTSYIESVWWLLKQIHDKGLLYEGFKIQWYSPGSGTVLSSHEVGLGYQEVQDPSVYVRFRLEDDPDTSFLAWTTTPWTLVSNAALAVGKKIDYVKVAVSYDDGETENLILARDLLHVLKAEYEILEEMHGRDLVGRRYEPLFDTFVGEEGTENAWRVCAADFVSTSDGTGIVHIAPAFGADDFELGQAEGLPLLNPITPEGLFDESVPM